MANVFKYFNRILVYNNYSFVLRNIRPITTLSTETNHENTLRSSNKATKVHYIQKLLNVNFRTALEVVNENRKLIEASSSLLRENFKILEDNGFDDSTALNYPHLLAVAELEEAICELKKLPYPLNITIVLAGLSKQMLLRLMNSYENSEDRISVISKLFQISHKEACEFLYSRNFLITRNLKTLGDIMKMILEFGISIEDLRKDPWVLRYSHHIMSDRIEFISDAKVDLLIPKPWMLRSPIEAIENYFKRRQVNRQILGSASLTEYLSEKLNCTEDQARFLISKMPALRTKSLRTLSDIINFLYSKGFKPFHIYRVPKVLVHSVETTKKRLEQMETAGIKVDSLYMLTKSQKQFMQHFEAMLKTVKTKRT